MHTFFQTCGTVRKLSIYFSYKSIKIFKNVCVITSLTPPSSLCAPALGRRSHDNQIHLLCGLRHPLNPSELTHSAIFKHPVWVRFVEIKEPRTLLALP